MLSLVKWSSHPGGSEASSAHSLSGFPPPVDNMENFEVASLPLDSQRNIEADSFWCMSKLLDGIQVCTRTVQEKRTATFIPHWGDLHSYSKEK